MIIKNIFFLIFLNLIIQTANCQVRIIDLRLKVLSPLPNSYIKSPGVIDLKFSIFNKGIDSIYKSDTLVCYFTTNDSHFKYRYIYFSKNIAPYDSEIFISKLPFNSKKDYNYWNVSASCQVLNRSKFIQNETVSQQNDNKSSFFLNIKKIIIIKINFKYNRNLKRRICMKKLVIFLSFATLLFAEGSVEQKTYNPNVDCLILEDENSIICKFEVELNNENNQTLIINWIDPNGAVSRTREMVIPAGDTSAYDFRYLDGREKGKWDFKIIYNNQEYTTKFELK